MSRGLLRDGAATCCSSFRRLVNARWKHRQASLGRRAALALAPSLVEDGEKETAALPADLGAPGKQNWSAWEAATGQSEAVWRAAHPVEKGGDASADAATGEGVAR